MTFDLVLIKYILHAEGEEYKSKHIKKQRLDTRNMRIPSRWGS